MGGTLVVIELHVLKSGKLGFRNDGVPLRAFLARCNNSGIEREDVGFAVLLQSQILMRVGNGKKEFFK